VLDAATPDTEGTGSHGGGAIEIPATATLCSVPHVSLQSSVNASLTGMAGDVNLFFNDLDGDTSVAEIEVQTSARHALHAAAVPITAWTTASFSLQVMIADQASRRHGLAATALQMLMAYAAQDLVSQPCSCGCDATCLGSCITKLHVHLQGVTRFCAKVGEDNSASLALFQQRLGFVEVSRSTVFQVRKYASQH
jgi:Acetyltransferase (GNAT) domain